MAGGSLFNPQRQVRPSRRSGQQQIRLQTQGAFGEGQARQIGQAAQQLGNLSDALVENQVKLQEQHDGAVAAEQTAAFKRKARQIEAQIEQAEGKNANNLLEQSSSSLDELGSQVMNAAQNRTQQRLIQKNIRKERDSILDKAASKEAEGRRDFAVNNLDENIALDLQNFGNDPTPQKFKSFADTLVSAVNRKAALLGKSNAWKQNQITEQFDNALDAAVGPAIDVGNLGAAAQLMQEFQGAGSREKRAELQGKINSKIQSGTNSIIEDLRDPNKNGRDAADKGLRTSGRIGDNFDNIVLQQLRRPKDAIDLLSSAETQQMANVFADVRNGSDLQGTFATFENEILSRVDSFNALLDSTEQGIKPLAGLASPKVRPGVNRLNREEMAQVTMERIAQNMRGPDGKQSAIMGHIFANRNAILDPNNTEDINTAVVALRGAGEINTLSDNVTGGGGAISIEAQSVLGQQFGPVFFPNDDAQKIVKGINSAVNEAAGAQAKLNVAASNIDAGSINDSVQALRSMALVNAVKQFSNKPRGSLTVSEVRESTLNMQRRINGGQIVQTKDGDNFQVPDGPDGPAGETTQKRNAAMSNPAFRDFIKRIAIVQMNAPQSLSSENVTAEQTTTAGRALSGLDTAFNFTSPLSPVASRFGLGDNVFSDFFGETLNLVDTTETVSGRNAAELASNKSVGNINIVNRTNGTYQLRVVDDAGNPIGTARDENSRTLTFTPQDIDELSDSLIGTGEQATSSLLNEAFFGLDLQPDSAISQLFGSGESVEDRVERANLPGVGAEQILEIESILKNEGQEAAQNRMREILSENVFQ